jgi:hypothetical protein
MKSTTGFSIAAIAISSVIITTVAIYQDVLSGLVAGAVLIIGLWGSYVLGRESRKSPPVRQSFRHLARLYGHLLALTEQLERDRRSLTGEEPGFDTERARLSLGNAEFYITQSVGFVAEAMEDWAELAPSEVEELKKQLQESRDDRHDDTVEDEQESGWVLVKDETQEQ